jgi:ASCH domain
MKAISIKQPWASLIAAGVKTLEIRQWPTDHRGPLLICSSRRPVIEGHRHGAALCIVNVVNCRRMTRDDRAFACISEFYPDFYAWELSNPRLIEPFSVMGQLRLFDIEDGLIRPMKSTPATAVS